MTVHMIPLIILAVYAIASVVVANIFLRRKLGADHFLVAARQLPLTLVVAVMVGDMVGGASTVGVCQRGFTDGISASLYSVSLGLAFFAVAATMARRFRALHAVTIPEVTGRIFDRKTRLATALVIGISYFFIGITQIMAGGALLSPLLNIGIMPAELISVVLFALIIIVGGLRSIALVNILQVVVIFGGMIAALIGSLILIGGDIAGGVARLGNTLPEGSWRLFARPPMVVSGEIIGTVFTFFAAQAAITGLFAARDTETAVKGTWIAGALVLPVGFGFALLGMCARIHFGETLPTGLSAAPAMMLALNPVLAGISICGLFAAIISTGPLNFLAPIQIFVRDIYIPHIRQSASDREILFLNRTLAVALLALGWFVAVGFEEILGITYWAFAFRAGIAVVLLAAVYLGAQRVSGDGAFWGLLAGVGVFAAWTLLGEPFGVHVAIPSLATVLVVSLAVSALLPRKQPLDPEVAEAIR